jgi:hypothetical protein
VTAPLVQRLQLVVDAVTGQSESRLASLARSATDTGQAADRGARDVESAAQRVADAQLKQADAAKAVQVAQLRLDELREKGTASGSQLAAAEGKVESAQRKLHVATRELTAAQAESATAQQEATAAAEEGGDSSNRLSDELSGLKDEVLGLVAGASLAGWVTSSFSGFLEGARMTGQLAVGMNATAEEAGRLTGVFTNMGLELGDILEIQATFAETQTDTADGLTTLGQELQHNADGTINWARTLEEFLGELQGVEDATERNRLGFEAFGEEGFTQLTTLLNSGKSLDEVFAAMGTPFTQEDVDNAARFDSAMSALQATSGGLGRELGATLLPIVTGLLEGFGDVVDVVTAVPAPIAVATAAAIALGVTGFSPTAAMATRLGAAATYATTQLATLRATAALTGATAAVAGLGMGAAAAGMSRGLALLGGPLGAALIAGGTAFHFASQGSDELETNAMEAAKQVEALEAAQSGVNDVTATAAQGMRNQSASLEENAGYWETSAAYVKGFQEDLSGWELALAKVAEPFQRLTMGASETADATRGFELAIEEARAELGEFGAQQAVAQVTTKTLNDLIAAGTLEGEEFGNAVRAAAEAQQEEARTSGLAEAAIAAYEATTTKAVEATLGFLNASLGAAGARDSFLDAMDAARVATDDATTSVNEQDQAYRNLQAAALRAAEGAADAAVEAGRANGVVMDEATEASTRAQSMLGSLRQSLNEPGMTERGRLEVGWLIERLEEAQASGDIAAVLTLTGAEEAAGELDETTEDRDTTVTVESRGGPAVLRYLDGIAEDRQTLVRVESRNGPAVDRYLDDVAGGDRRLSLIRVESRNGPAVEDYLNGRARDRLALIYVETRGGPAVDRYLDDLAARRTAVIDVQRTGAGRPGGGVGAAGLMGAGGYGAAGITVQQLTVQVQADAGGRLTQQSLAEAGRQAVAAIGAYERRSGTGWRR